ncbi:MAG: sodium:solute symporter family protein [Planctomycetes bacterium]|nr:sodium:solute symporter family protein [Planctomycetota bacterium]
MRIPPVQIGALDTAIVVAYLVGMVAVGVWVSRRIGGFDDFFVAGGRMTTPLLVCTLVSTYYGLDVTFGTSETAYLEGISAFFAYSAPFYVAYVAMAVLVAPRLHRYSARSLPETMELHYGRGARVASALSSFVYSAPILGIGGMGLIGSVFFGLDPWVGAVVGASVALIYTVLGGLLADALTDTIQFTMMCVTVAIAAVYALLEFGTPDVLATKLDPTVFTPYGDLTTSQILVYGSVALTPLVEPAFYQRTFASKDARQIVRALLIGVVLWMAYDWLIVLLGIGGQELVRRGELPADVPSWEILLHVVEHLLPPGLLGIFLAGCLASAMSTIDSYALIGAGNLVYDAWAPVVKRKPGDATLLRATRLMIVPTIGFALLVSTVFDSLRDAWIFMATVLLSTNFVPMMAALFFLERPSPRAGTWSAATGLVGSLGLFLCFLLAGRELDDGDVVWTTPFGGELVREEALLFTVPASALAFAAGRVADRRARAAA